MWGSGFLKKKQSINMTSMSNTDELKAQLKTTEDSIANYRRRIEEHQSMIWTWKALLKADERKKAAIEEILKQNK